MGKSKGGEGSGQSPRADKVARALARSIQEDDRQVSEVRVQWLSGDLYAVEVRIHGEPEPERFFAEGDTLKEQ